MAGNVYEVFQGLAANADQIETGWTLALISSTVSGLALNSDNPTAVVAKLQSFANGSVGAGSIRELLDRACNSSLQSERRGHIRDHDSLRPFNDGLVRCLSCSELCRTVENNSM